MEAVPTGDTKEGARVFEKGKNGNPQEMGLYFSCCLWNNLSWCYVDFFLDKDSVNLRDVHTYCERLSLSQSM